MRIGRFSLWAVLLLLMIGAQGLQNAQAIIDQLARKAKTTRAYSYQWEFQRRDPKTGKLSEKQIYKLEFLQPHYRKLTIIQRDFFSNGAVLTYNPDKDSRVHARKGLIHRTYEPNDPEVADFFRTDLVWIAGDIQRLFKTGKVESVQTVNYRECECYRLAFATKDSLYRRVVLWLEKRDAMPIRIEYYDSKGLYSVREFTNYAFPTLKPDDFPI